MQHRSEAVDYVQHRSEAVDYVQHRSEAAYYVQNRSEAADYVQHRFFCIQPSQQHLHQDKLAVPCCVAPLGTSRIQDVLAHVPQRWNEQRRQPLLHCY